MVISLSDADKIFFSNLSEERPLSHQLSFQHDPIKTSVTLTSAVGSFYLSDPKIWNHSFLPDALIVCLFVLIRHRVLESIPASGVLRLVGPVSMYVCVYVPFSIYVHTHTPPHTFIASLNESLQVHWDS